ncbi:MAG TPA: LytTR family transcriptional regulator DNA-binding domain-containing protein [Cyclobacteriaceae bacterium]|nr:LytTR family transcriptional regulator DNA-binding domain-containing protein [Cyclobacteriaceae bacterium]HMV08174.1 LytTR family transcriptional regulator DNA-binding domain-containing protein [Cyclobacteriaceae bacterium]HMX00815.1 LytTR family transcriptional regulator DNA-binding domain-containing protein [Cyclobacteriaceae bacterium]HMX49310.1 LytTR family transcriptional regulator DNA-binding domain-containing protein [Cyclobacteriaceae bacterium]HMY93618.1 LytTR family transcriptional
MALKNWFKSDICPFDPPDEMKKKHLYIWTLLGLLVTVVAIISVAESYLFSSTRQRLLTAQLETSKREAREVGRLLEEQLADGSAPSAVTENLQRSIENTDSQSGFICMYDTTGMELCHPDRSRIGQMVTEGNSQVNGLGENTSQSLFKVLMQGEASGGLRTFGDKRESEIIYVYPVQKTGWMVAAHANLVAINSQLDDLRNKFLFTHIIAGVLIILFSFLLVRFIGGRYETGLETEKSQLQEDLRKLSLLNADLVSYREKIERMDVTSERETDDSIESTVNRKRILTYWRDELVSLTIENIAFFYTQESATHIHCRDGKVYIHNDSLDDLMKQLNAAVFFRANRQFIVSIHAIDKIYRYGKNQLKITVIPDAPEVILISKNNAATFKEWLNI